MVRALRGLSVRDVVIAVTVMLALCAGVVARYRVVAEVTETAAVDDAIHVAGRDVKRLADTMAAVQRRARRLSAAASIVNAAVLRGDNAAWVEALQDLNTLIGDENEGVFMVSAVNAQGIVTWSTRNNAMRGADLSTRPHVRAVLSGAQTFAVGAVLTGMLSGNGVMPFVTVEKAEDGRITGAIVVSFAVRWLDGLSREIMRFDGDVINFIADHRTILLRSDGTLAGYTGTPEERAGLFEQRTAGGLFVTRSIPGLRGGLQRIAVSADVPGSNLSVMVAVDRDAALRDARATIADNRLMAVFACLLITGLTLTVLAVLRQSRLTAAERARAEGEAQRRALAEELEKVRAERQSLINVAPGWLFYAERNAEGQSLGQVQWISEQSSRFLGYPGAAWEAPDFVRSIVHPEDAGRYDAAIAQMMDDGTVTAEWRMLAADGTYCWVRVAANSSRRADGSFVNVGYAFDISEQKATEAELAQAQTDLNALIELAPGWLYQTERTAGGKCLGRVQWITKRPTPFLGYAEEVWQQPGFGRSIVHPEDLALYEQGLADLVSAGTAAAEYRQMAADGTYRWIRNTGSQTVNEVGNILIAGFTFDITDQKATEEQLAQAQKILGLGLIATGIGHELGQPLGAISLAAESGLLALRPGDAAGLDFAEAKLRRIIALTERASGIIATMTAADSDSTLPRTLLPIGELIGNAVATTRERCARAGVTVRVRCPAGGIVVDVARLTFELALTNLIENAVDAYAGQPGEIEIVAEVDDAVVRLRVKDRAGGIPAEAVGKVFEPFYTTRRAAGGKGLGLSTCFAIVQRAGGTISAANVDGGAEFEITLPMADVAAN